MYNVDDYSLQDAYNWLLNPDNIHELVNGEHHYYLYNSSGGRPESVEKAFNMSIYLYVFNEYATTIDIFYSYVEIFKFKKRKIFYLSDLEDIIQSEESYFQYSLLETFVLPKEEIQILIKIMKKMSITD